jgi:hypothetical protein
VRTAAGLEVPLVQGGSELVALLTRETELGGAGRTEVTIGGGARDEDGVGPGGRGGRRAASR